MSADVSASASRFRKLGIHPKDDVRACLYGIYQQAVHGDTASKEANAGAAEGHEGALYVRQCRAAWLHLQGTDRETAAELYSAAVTSFELDGSWSPPSALQAAVLAVRAHPAPAPADVGTADVPPLLPHSAEDRREHAPAASLPQPQSPAHPAQPPAPLCTGWLLKHREHVPIRPWRARWFALHTTTGEIEYYERQPVSGEKAKDVLVLGQGSTVLVWAQAGERHEGGGGTGEESTSSSNKKRTSGRFFSPLLLGKSSSPQVTPSRAGSGGQEEEGEERVGGAGAVPVVSTTTTTTTPTRRGSGSARSVILTPARGGNGVAVLTPEEPPSSLGTSASVFAFTLVCAGGRQVRLATHGVGGEASRQAWVHALTAACIRANSTPVRPSSGRRASLGGIGTGGTPTPVPVTLTVQEGEEEERHAAANSSSRRGSKKPSPVPTAPPPPPPRIDAARGSQSSLARVARAVHVRAGLLPWQLPTRPPPMDMQAMLHARLGQARLEALEGDKREPLDIVAGTSLSTCALPALLRETLLAGSMGGDRGEWRVCGVPLGHGCGGDAPLTLTLASAPTPRAGTDAGNTPAPDVCRYRCAATLPLAPSTVCALLWHGMGGMGGRAQGPHRLARLPKGGSTVQQGAVWRDEEWIVSGAASPLASLPVTAGYSLLPHLPLQPPHHASTPPASIAAHEPAIVMAFHVGSRESGEECLELVVTLRPMRPAPLLHTAVTWGVEHRRGTGGVGGQEPALLLHATVSMLNEWLQSCKDVERCCSPPPPVPRPLLVQQVGKGEQGMHHPTHGYHVQLQDMQQALGYSSYTSLVSAFLSLRGPYYAGGRPRGAREEGQGKKGAMRTPDLPPLNITVMVLLLAVAGVRLFGAWGLLLGLLSLTSLTPRPVPRAQAAALAACLTVGCSPLARDGWLRYGLGGWIACLPFSMAETLLASGLPFLPAWLLSHLSSLLLACAPAYELHLLRRTQAVQERVAEGMMQGMRDCLVREHGQRRVVRRVIPSSPLMQALCDTFLRQGGGGGDAAAPLSLPLALAKAVQLAGMLGHAGEEAEVHGRQPWSPCIPLPVPLPGSELLAGLAGEGGGEGGSPQQAWVLVQQVGGGRGGGEEEEASDPLLLADPASCHLLALGVGSLSSPAAPLRPVPRVYATVRVHASPGGGPAAGGEEGQGEEQGRHMQGTEASSALQLAGRLAPIILDVYLGEGGEGAREDAPLSLHCSLAPSVGIGQGDKLVQALAGWVGSKEGAGRLMDAVLHVDA